MVSISHSHHSTTHHSTTLCLRYHLAHCILFSIWLLVHQVTLFALLFINLFLCNCSCYFLKAFEVAQMIEVWVCARIWGEEPSIYLQSKRNEVMEREAHKHTVTCNCYGTKSIIQFTYNTILMQHQHQHHDYSYYSAHVHMYMPLVWQSPRAHM